MRLHIDYLGHAPLHDQKVRIVHVEFHGGEEISDFFLGLNLAVDVTLDFVLLNGARDIDAVLGITWRLLSLFRVIKNQRD